MNRFTQLVGTDAVALRRFEHVPGVAHRDPEQERAVRHGINFVEAGSFRVRTTGAWREVTCASLFVTTPGLEFSCAHEDEYPSDCCLSVTYAEAAVDSARAWATLGEAPVRPLTNRRAYLRHALRGCHVGDEARTEALAGALLFSLATATSRQPLFRPERLAWYAARVDRAKALIEARYAEPLSLSLLARDAGMSVFHFARVFAQLARDAGMSVFHFARVFAQLEGRPPHRALTEVRLAHAAARLRDGAGVTDTCFAVGFGSLSHFVTTFRRRYGTRPSDLRPRQRTTTRRR